jgi:hypothetical protein
MKRRKSWVSKTLRASVAFRKRASHFIFSGWGLFQYGEPERDRGVWVDRAEGGFGFLTRAAFFQCRSMVVGWLTCARSDSKRRSPERLVITLPRYPPTRVTDNRHSVDDIDDRLPCPRPGCSSLSSTRRHCRSW